MERRNQSGIIIESGFEAIYMDEDVIYRGPAEIWHVPANLMRRQPAYDLVKISVKLLTGDGFTISAAKDNPSIKILEKEN